MNIAGSVEAAVTLELTAWTNDPPAMNIAGSVEAEAFSGALEVIHLAALS